MFLCAEPQIFGFNNFSAEKKPLFQTFRLSNRRKRSSLKRLIQWMKTGITLMD